MAAIESYVTRFNRDMNHRLGWYETVTPSEKGGALVLSQSVGDSWMLDYWQNC